MSPESIFNAKHEVTRFDALQDVLGALVLENKSGELNFLTERP